MVATNYSALRTNLKDYCDKASDGETVLVTRKEDKNVVVMSLENYNEMVREISNYQYMTKLDRAFRQLESGQGQEHDLIEE